MEGKDLTNRPAQSDLAFVERIIDKVVTTLGRLSAESEDVDVAAHYNQCIRDFPIAFLQWATAQPDVQEACHESPLFANILQPTADWFPPNQASIPAVCIKSLVYINDPIKDEVDWLRKEREAAKKVEEHKNKQLAVPGWLPLIPSSLRSSYGDTVQEMYDGLGDLQKAEMATDPLYHASIRDRIKGLLGIK